MKQLTFVLMMVVLCCTQSFAQKVVAPRSGVVGSWRSLGTTSVKFTVDHDGIVVEGADAFRALKFKVYDASVEMLNMEVIYEDGEPDKLEVSAVIPKNGESRVIDLRGGDRRIKRVDFWYKSGVPNFRGRAKIELWGMK